MLKELGASLLFEKGIEKTVKWYLFSKTYPSFLTVKEGAFESLRLPLAKGSSTSNQAFSIVFKTLSVPLIGDRNLLYR